MYPNPMNEFYLRQAQSYQQPLPFTYEPQINASWVTSVEEARAAQMNFASTNIYLDTSCGKIYLKRIGDNGKPQFLSYVVGELKLQMAEGFGQNRFDSAMNTAAINATTTAQTQKILDALSQNKIETLQGKVNQLELQNALSGVVRYPNGYTYNAGPGPFCNCNGYNGYPLFA